MAFTSGTATNYHDLLDKLRLWLTGTVGWIQLRWNAPATITSTAELWLRGAGAGTDKQVFIGFQSQNNTSTGAYGWACRAATSFNSASDFISQPNTGPAVYFNTWQNSISYWFYANTRRVVVVAKVGTVYQSMYSGFFLPYALPAEYPFPLIVLGSYVNLAVASLNNSGNRMIVDPGNGAGSFRRRDVSSWKVISNHDNTTNANYDPTGNYSGGQAIIWPHRVGRDTDNTTQSSWGMAGNFAKWRPNANSEMPLFQAQIMDLENRSLVGALDGVFATPGFGRNSEQLTTSGGRTFRYFQNVMRSTGRDFFAVEEI